MPNARARKDMFVDRVRRAGARSADGGWDEEDATVLVEDGPAERVAHVEILE